MILFLVLRIEDGRVDRDSQRSGRPGQDRARTEDGEWYQEVRTEREPST